MLGSFIRLVDYMLVEALVDRTVGTVEELVAMLEAPQASTDKTHKVCYAFVQATAQVTPGVLSMCAPFGRTIHHKKVSVTGSLLQYMRVTWLSSILLLCRECF